MAFNSDMPHDVQQFPEIWGNSRFTQRQDALEDERTGDFHERQLHEVPQENLEPNPNLQNEHDSGNNIRDEAVNTGEVDQLSDKSEDDEEDDILEAAAVKEAIKTCTGAPTWLSSAIILRERTERALDAEDNELDAAEKWCPVCSATGSQSCMCGMPMQAGDNTTMPFPNQSAYTHWLSMQGAMHAPQQHRVVELVDVKDADFGVPHPPIRNARTELNLSAAPQDGEGEKFLDLGHPVGGPTYPDDYAVRVVEQAEWDSGRQKPAEWEIARDKALVINHPLYPELLTAHAACLRVGTPVDQLPHIEAQLAQAHLVTQKYSVLQPDQLDITYEEKFELDHVMTQYTMLLTSFKDDLQQHVNDDVTEAICYLQTQYTMHLTSFKDNLQQHVYNDVTEAMMSCWELEQALHTITGVSPGGGTGATMSDGEDDYDSDYEANYLDPHDSGGFGPLVPTESERTLMERVRQELKYELKQGYRARIEDVREEILRKRRAGKLPEGTTTVLKAWWQSHSKWPYPTEDEKERLIQETGLELKQVNNWFINQRKRNWHSNPLAATTDLKTKRKSW